MCGVVGGGASLCLSLSLSRTLSLSLSLYLSVSLFLSLSLSLARALSLSISCHVGGWVVVHACLYILCVCARMGRVRRHVHLGDVWLDTIPSAVTPTAWLSRIATSSTLLQFMICRAA